MESELIVCHNDAQNARSYYLVSCSHRTISCNIYFKTNDKCIQFIRISGKLRQHTSRCCCMGLVEYVLPVCRGRCRVDGEDNRFPEYAVAIYISMLCCIV
jgi:hypothetical protein